MKNIISYFGGKCKSNKLCIIELAFKRDESDLAPNPIGQTPDLCVVFLENAFLLRTTEPSVNGFVFPIINVFPGCANVSEKHWNSPQYGNAGMEFSHVGREGFTCRQLKIYPGDIQVYEIYMYKNLMYLGNHILKLGLVWVYAR